MRHSQRALKLASSSTCVDVLRGWDDNLLLLVVVSSALSLVLSLLYSCLLVAFIEVKDDVGVEGLDLLLQVRHRLNSINKCMVRHQKYEVRL